MLGKVHTPQTNEAEHFVLKVFEKLNFINLKEDKLITRPRIFVPDFILQYKNQKYCLEVKLNFVISFLSKTITNFSHLLKQNDYYGIIVILDKVPQDFKDLIKEDYNITIYDISNILYLIGDNEELQNDLKKVISFSLNDIIPERVDFNKTIESLPKTKTNYILELENIKEGKEGASEYETLLEKIIKEIFFNFGFYKMRSKI